MPRLIYALLLLSIASPASAITTLKQVQVARQDRVDLLFDRDVDVRQIRTEFFRDIVQLSINNVAVYPAKIFSVKGQSISKVFAYQYTPKLIRCRLTVNGNAEDFRNRVRVTKNGRIITVRIAPHANKDKIITQSAQSLSSAAPVGKKGLAKPSKITADERALLSKITKQSLGGFKKKKTQNRLTTGRVPKINFAAAFGWLAILIALIGGFVVLLRKLRNRGSSTRDRGVLNRILRRGKSDNMVELIATHYLGPKKSIAIVKVKGRQLVLGVTEESINLITRLDDNAEIDFDDDLESEFTGAGATAAGPASFSGVLGQERAKPVERTSTGVRDRIKQKVQGLKSL